MLHHTFSLPSLLPGEASTAVSGQSVPLLRSGMNHVGHDRSRFTDGYLARLAVPTVIPPGLPQTPVHMAVPAIVEHPTQEGDTNCCARTTELMAKVSMAGTFSRSLPTIDHPALALWTATLLHLGRGGGGGGDGVHENFFSGCDGVAVERSGLGLRARSPVGGGGWHRTFGVMNNGGSSALVFAAAKGARDMSLKRFSLRLWLCPSVVCLTAPVVHAHRYPTAGGIVIW